MDAVRVEGYTMLGVAGRGGMGIVYRARRTDGTLVALKVVAPELVASDEFARRFAREATLAAQLEHPHIVPVIETGTTSDGRPFLAFAYIKGTDLDKYLRENGKLDPPEVARIVTQIAGALDTAHAHGFVHRDVKPANVLLDEAGTAFLSDFGLTRPVSGTRFTRSGAWLGTVDYAAPEQIQGRHVDARADIYALAAMTYQMLTGTVPFPRDSDLAKLWAHVNDERPKLPSGVEHRTVLAPVIERGLARSPDQRYLSAGDFAGALGAAAAGQTARIDEHMVAAGDAAPSQAATVQIAGADHAAPRQVGHPPEDFPTHRSSRRTRLGIATGAGLLVLAVAGLIAVLALPQRQGKSAGRALTAATPTPTATAVETATASSAATATPTPTAARRPRPVASPRRPDDLPIVLDADTYMPTQIGTWNPYKNASVAAARRAFGPDYATTITTGECILEWPHIGLRVHFADLSGTDACGDRTGLAQSIEVDGIISDRWRTLSGLRPDMRESAIRKLYPRARKHNGDWWLITAKSLIGDGGYYAPISAAVHDGRVTGFDVWVGGAGE